MPAPLSCSAVLTHHWLVRRRGGEKVLEALAELVPDAPLYTLVSHTGYADEHPDSPLAGRQIHASPLRWIPGATYHYPNLAPLMPLAARRVRLPDVDLVLCSDAAIAKAMRPHRRSRLVCYCHSPPRYAWQARLRRAYRLALPRWQRPAWNATMAYIRRADARAAQRVDLFVANSAHVAKRIARCYGRESVVVHPPVELPPEPSCGPRADFYLCVGHHVPYKRLDLAVEACRGLQRRLVVIGEGPDVERLNLRLQPHVEYLGWQPDAVVHDYMSRARALLFPGEEDFGIVPVEAMARGCPVMAYGVGGARETVVSGATGMLFERQTGEALVEALQCADELRFDPILMHRHVQRFSREQFQQRMHEVLTGVLDDGRDQERSR